MNKDLKLLLIFVLVICLYLSYSCPCNKNNVVEGIGGTTTVVCDNDTGYMGDLTYTCGGADGTDPGYALGFDDQGNPQQCGIKNYSNPADFTGYLIDSSTSDLSMPTFNVTATCDTTGGWGGGTATNAGGSRPQGDTTGQSADLTTYVLSGCSDCALQSDTGATDTGCEQCLPTEQSLTVGGVCNDRLSPYASDASDAPIGITLTALQAAGIQ